ncbi:MAG TPA: copper resistance protein CopC, partial [Methylocystis sp.]|nr:copper resistance protein CopC [Methylocystis sp.]
MATKLLRAHLFLLFALIAFWPPPAAAHAIVVASSPAQGQRLAQGECKIELRFNSRIDRARSRLVLLRPD